MKNLLHFLAPALLVASGIGSLLAAAPAAAQSRNLYDWAWVNRLGATALAGTTTAMPASAGQPESLAADAAGNVFVAGLYAPDVVFDNANAPYQATVTSSGAIPNSYLAKYTPAGALAWSRDLTSNGAVLVRDVAVDGAGNVYVIGKYNQQLRIDGAVVALASTGNSYFLTKISPAGAPVWTTTIEPDVPRAGRFGIDRLDVDAAGNSAVLGEFETQLTINGTAFAGATSSLHCLVLRYNSLGATLGSFAAYTTGSEQGRTYTGIALTSTGETYLSGRVFNTATLQFGTLPALTGPAPIAGIGYSAGFVVKLNGATTAAWAVSTTAGAGPTATAQGVTDIAIGPQDRCYALGLLRGGGMALGAQSIGTANPQGATGYDLFLARINPSGAVESLVGGGGTFRAWGLAIGPQGQASFGTDGGLDWGNVRLSGPIWNSSSTATRQTGIVQLDAAGVPQRGWQAGMGFFTSALTLDGLNRPVLVGTAGGYGPYNFGTQQRTSPYAFNTLVARTGTTLLAARQATQVAGLEVYPNPAQRLVEVRTAQPGPVEIRLSDVLGRTVRTQRLAAGQTRVELAGLAAGAYTLHVQQGAARSFRQLVVAP